MIGMILLAVLAVAIFFGITDKFFRKMGVANWVAFLVVLAFAVAAVFPPLMVGAVTLSYAGFFLPLLLGIVAMFALGANSSLLRAVVGALSVAGIVLATRIAFVPTGYNSAIPSILIVGFAAGIASYIIGQGRLAVMASCLIGIVIGDFITSMIFRFAFSGNYILALGQNGIFDTVVLTLIVGEVSLMIGNAIIKSVRRKTAEASIGAVTVTAIEAAEDNPIEKPENAAVDEDDDLYDEYFNDDID